ncbi:MAG: TRAP transporter substrate-binding protein [Defluviitaleaceae bacterium]|nr:TRAP transporter substrate-binding protein [Defluviitaleaceae bacterium]
MKMFRTLIPLTIATAMLAGCAGGGAAAPAAGGGGGAAAEPSPDPIVINISHINAPTHPVNLGLLLFADEIYERSGGQLIAHVFDSAVIGGDISNIQQVAANQLEAGLIMGVCMWDGFDTRANLEMLPFLFDTYDEAIAAFDGELGRWSTENIIEPHGGVVINYWINGLRNFTNSVRPIYTPADVAGLMWRTPQIEISMDMFEVLGASAITMAFAEVYTALQQGTMDGQCNSLAMIYTSRFYEVNEFVSLSRHQFASGVLLFSEETWASLTPEQQEIIHEAAYIGARHAQQMMFDYEEQWIEHMVASGNQVNQIDVQSFRDGVEPLWQAWIDRYGTEFINIASQYVQDPNALANRFADQ